MLMFLQFELSTKTPPKYHYPNPNGSHATYNSKLAFWSSSVIVLIPYIQVDMVIRIYFLNLFTENNLSARCNDNDLVTVFSTFHGYHADLNYFSRHLFA